MTALPPATLEQIRRRLVGLKMPRALEILDSLVRRLEQGHISALEAADESWLAATYYKETRRVLGERDASPAGRALDPGQRLVASSAAGFPW